MKLSINKYEVLAGTAIACGIFGLYKLISWSIEQDRIAEAEAAERRRQFNLYAESRFEERDYRSDMRQASTFNPHLDAHQRNVAYDMLNVIWCKAVKDTSESTLDADLENLDTCLDILLGDDEVAVLAMIEREIRAEESRKVKAQRDHELALAKAAGEKEIEVAKIAADAEKSKASLYSDSIKSAAEFFKEVKDERSEKPED